MQPADGAAGLQPIIVTQFPFLISKADATFARYRESHAQQVNFLSRRHAHVFLKRGMPQVEDLGSTNGTFVNGRRLDEHATPLEDGDTIGFGGRFFVYRIALQKEEVATDPTLTCYTGIALQPNAIQRGTPGLPDAVVIPDVSDVADVPGKSQPMRFDVDRTTFIGAPNSFLDIFCVDSAPAVDGQAVAAIDGSGRREPMLYTAQTGLQSGDSGTATAGPINGAAVPTGSSGDATAAPGAAARRGGAHRRRSQIGLLAGQVVTALSARDRARLRKAAIACAAGVFLASGVGLAAHLLAGDERKIRTLAAAGSFDQAVRAADRYLAQHPEDTDMRALATQSWLKAFVPQWLLAATAGDAGRTAAVLKTMRGAAQHNPDAIPLLRELEWIGELDGYIGPGTEAQIRMDADEHRIARLLEQWDADLARHQRAAGTIAAQVPAFRDAYAAALSRLRRLQGDSAVYLAAIARLKITVAAQLNNDHPETIGPLIASYAEKYPRLAGLERIEADTQQYLRLQATLQNGRLGAVVSQLERTQFATPLFQARLQALVAARRLPDADLVQRYRSLRAIWRTGDTQRALAALQSLTTGSWGAAAVAEHRHKADIAARFEAIQSANGAPGHAEQLLAFHDLLDADEDGYFVKAVQAGPGVPRNGLIRRADAYAMQASALWQQYRQAGTPDDAARRDDSTGAGFRAQARLLVQARSAALQAERLYRLLDAPLPAAASQRLTEILLETSVQRDALRDAQPPLPPELLAARLAVLEVAGTNEVPP